MQAPVEYRVLLVSSSVINGAINSLVAAYAHSPIVILANTTLMFRFVRRWSAANNRNTLRIAAVVACTMHTVVIADRHSLLTALDWGCMLIALSYYTAYVAERYRLSFFVWFLFHCVQTYNNIGQYIALASAV